LFSKKITTINLDHMLKKITRYLISLFVGYVFLEFLFSLFSPEEADFFSFWSKIYIYATYTLGLGWKFVHEIDNEYTRRLKKPLFGMEEAEDGYKDISHKYPKTILVLGAIILVSIIFMVTIFI
jgi:hypothetical protein